MKIKLDTKKIYLAMAEKGLTITEIAKQGGISQQAVSNALNGNRVGKVKVVPAICQALELSAKDIVIIEDQLPPEQRKGGKMEDRYYEVIIPVSIYINDAMNPSIIFDTYEEAVKAAKPWIDQKYDVVITARYYKDEDDYGEQR